MTYQELKGRARDEAIEWQTQYFPNNSMSWGELAYWEDHFTKLAKRYGLTKEFKENCII